MGGKLLIHTIKLIAKVVLGFFFLHLSKLHSFSTAKLKAICNQTISFGIIKAFYFFYNEFQLLSVPVLVQLIAAVVS